MCDRFFHGLRPGIQTQAKALVLRATSMGICLHERFQAGCHVGHQAAPLAGDELSRFLQRFGRQLVGKQGLLKVLVAEELL